MTALTQVDVLAEQISASIMTGEYPIGTWLRQESLAERYGVSRQPVREALRQVQASGLVEVIAHRGALVSGPSPRDIREAYMVRGELEGLAAEIATERLTLDDLETMRAAEHTFREASERVTAGPPAAEDDFGWANANDQFHEAILACRERPHPDRVDPRPASGGAPQLDLVGDPVAPVAGRERRPARPHPGGHGSGGRRPGAGSHACAYPAIR